MAKQQTNAAKIMDTGPLSTPATWASAQLIGKTRRVSAEEYGRPVDEAEAMKIVSKAGKLIKALYPELDAGK